MTGWHSIHVFADWVSHTELLRAAVPLARASDQWFFIRYAEGGPHLRIRMRNPASAAVSDQLCAALREGGARTVCRATYERELERYGGEDAIEAAERVFAASSELAVGELDDPAGRRRCIGLGATLAVSAWAIAGFDDGAAAAYYAAELEKVVSSIEATAGPRLRPPTATGIEVARRWREWGLRWVREPDAGSAPYIAALHSYTARLRRLSVSRREVLNATVSQIHMTCNRLGLSIVDELLTCRALATASGAAHPRY